MCRVCGANSGGRDASGCRTVFPILDLRCMKWLGSSGRPSRAGSGGIAGHGTGRGDVPVTICPALPGGLPVRSPRRGRGGDELPALVRSPRLSLSSVLRRAGCRGLCDPGPGPAPTLLCALLRRRMGARARSSHVWSASGCLCQGRAVALVPQLSARSTQLGGESRAGRIRQLGVFLYPYMCVTILIV